VAQALVAGVEGAVEALTLSLGQSDVAAIKMQLAFLNTELLELSKAFYHQVGRLGTNPAHAEHVARPSTEVDQVVAQLLVRKPPSTSVVTRQRENEGEDNPWNFAI
jgi:hypothetical protein